MNYKITTILLAAILSAGIVYHFMSDEARPMYFEVPEFNSGENIFTFNKLEVTEGTVAEVNRLLMHDTLIQFSEKEVINYWITSRLDSTKGDSFSPEEAGLKMKKFVDWNKTEGNFIREIVPYGFTFGKHTLRQMIREIDNINRQYPVADSDKMIYGVRLNLCVGKDPRAKRGNMDVMIIPVKNNGKSYFDFEKDKSLHVVSGTLINTSSPCPSMCN